MEFDRGFDEVLEMRLCADDPELRRGVRPEADRIPADRLAEFVRVAQHVAQIVGDLIGFPELFAELAPRLGFHARRRGAGLGRADEQRACLRLLIISERDSGFTRPATMPLGAPTAAATIETSMASRDGVAATSRANVSNAMTMRASPVRTAIGAPNRA